MKTLDGFRDRPRVSWIIHYSENMIFVALLALIGLDLATINTNSMLFFILSGIPLYTLVVAALYHGSRLCEHCITSTPINPSLEAERHERSLQIWHKKHAISIAFIVYLVFLLAIVPLVEHFLPKGYIRAHVIRQIPYLIWFPMMYVFRMHSRLRPWCPWCRDDGGWGFREVVPDPQEDHGKPVLR